MEIAIKRFIDVEIEKGMSSIATTSFGIPILITDSSRITTATRVKVFTSQKSVELLFGKDSEEFKVADAYFNQDPFNEFAPEKLLIGRYVDKDISAVLECGEKPLADIDAWKKITDGEFGIEIDGSLVNVSNLNFSQVTSLDDVASVLSGGTSGATVEYVINRFVFSSETTGVSSKISLLKTVATQAGTDISGLNFIDGDKLSSPLNKGGSLLSQGQEKETAVSMIESIKNENNSWYALGVIKNLRDKDITEAIADVVESYRNIMITTTNDKNTLVLNSNASLASKLKDKNYKRTAFVYNENEDVYPCFSWMGQQLPKEPGSTNWAYQKLAGKAQGALQDIEPSKLTQEQIDAAENVNVNVYTETLGSTFIYFGTMVGGKNAEKDGEYIDLIINIDFLQARIEEGMMSLLVEKDIIPFTDGGITICETRLKNILQKYGVDKGILVDGTVKTFFPKRADVSTANRDNRKLPDGTFSGELSGGINKVVLRGKLNI